MNTDFVTKDMTSEGKTEKRITILRPGHRREDDITKIVKKQEGS